MTAEEKFIEIYRNANAQQRQRINDILYGASLVARGEQNEHIYSPTPTDPNLPRNREEVEAGSK